MNLAKRSISSASWTISISLISVAVAAVRSVLLARLLPVEVFGIYALGASVMVISVQFLNFGMPAALLHRAPESQDEDQAASVHFTLKCIFALVWVSLMVGGTLAFTTGATRTALLLLTCTTAGLQLAQTARIVLIRRVEHRRLAILQLLVILVSSIVAVILAWQNAGLWALLSTNVVTLLLTIILLYVWRPVWRPRLTWSPKVMRYFVSFGSRTFASSLLTQALNELDDVWTGLALGQAQLGFYSRAYTFATYPRHILAMPINAVAGGTFAELKGNRQLLSKAFFRSTAFLVRSGFLLAGLMALLAPEFIRLVLTEKWMPMLDSFRLMLVFTLLDPINVTLSHLFNAVGKPEQVMRARLIQLVVLIGGLLALGRFFGISGVALSVNVMMLTGIVILLIRARTYVDYSPLRLFGAPSLALLLGMGLTYAILTASGIAGSDWLTGSIKAIVFSLVYCLVLLLLERDLLLSMLSRLRKNMFSTSDSELGKPLDKESTE